VPATTIHSFCALQILINSRTTRRDRYGLVPLSCFTNSSVCGQYPSCQEAHPELTPVNLTLPLHKKKAARSRSDALLSGSAVADVKKRYLVFSSEASAYRAKKYVAVSSRGASVKRSIYAAFVVASILSLQPFEIGDARSTMDPALPVSAQQTQHLSKVRHNTKHQDSAKRTTVRKLIAKAKITKTKLAKKRKVAKIARKLPAKGNPKIAKCALNVAKNMNTVGYCYRGVKGALRPLGIHLSGAAAYEAKDQLLRDKRFAAFSINGVNDLKPGDILVHGASSSHPYGHIAVYIGNRHEASDHVQQVIVNGPYSGTTVFRYGAQAYHTDNTVIN
jgi:hypothetical protein